MCYDADSMYISAVQLAPLLSIGLSISDSGSGDHGVPTSGQCGRGSSDSRMLGIQRHAAVN